MLVSHGGIGTVSQGLAAGVPQLIMPMAFDQPDNLARLRRLGVAAGLSPRRFTAGRVAARLATLLDDPAVRVAADECATRLREDGDSPRAPATASNTCMPKTRRTAALKMLVRRTPRLSPFVA